MNENPVVHQLIFAKQILAHQHFLFLVDAAGQLWAKPIAALGNATKPWQSISLPCSPNP